MDSPEHHVLSFLLVALRPPPDATAAQIRRAGALTMALGLAALLASVGLLALLVSTFGLDTDLALEVVMPLWFLAVGGLVIGLFRLLLAREPGSMGSVARLTLGVVFGFGSLVLFTVAALGSAILLEWLRGRLRS